MRFPADQSARDDPGRRGRGPLDSARPATKDLAAAPRAALDAVRDVGSPLGAHGGRRVSGDGTADLVTFEIAGPGAEFDANRRAAGAVVEKLTRQHPGARVDQAGDASLASAASPRARVS
ncbi:hypothetical protein ACFXI8_05475 [Streptomyces niveus]|uniref:hypothetical protein n=1 Tax=Streptomyces niveus TaxID=193462 RepID=UPI00369E0E78